MFRRVVVAAVVVLGGLAVAAPAHAVDPPLEDAVQVDGGDRHSCAVKANHRAVCWGDSTLGQVGYGAVPSLATAHPVIAVDGVSLLASVRQITAGGQHSCAVLNNNEARCWGDNSQGQLGTGGASTNHAAVVSNPAGSGPLTGVRTITAGAAHTCALLVNGQVRCWGANAGGQLGDNTTTPRPRPVVVRSTNGTGALSGVVQLSAGSFHTCATLGTGQVRCWGVGEHGRIGDGTQADRKHPVRVLAVAGTGPLTDVVQVVGGSAHTCARLSNRQVRCWGINANHELGIQAPAVQRLRPVVVQQRTPSHPPLTGVIGLGAGSNTTCAVLNTREVRCWGDDQQGELGNGTTTGQVGPVAVRSPAGGIDPPPGPGNLTGITQVGGGGDHVCARRNDGRAFCWGSNTYEQIGNGGGNDPVHRPTSVLEAT